MHYIILLLTYLTSVKHLVKNTVNSLPHIRKCIDVFLMEFDDLKSVFRLSVLKSSQFCQCIFNLLEIKLRSIPLLTLQEVYFFNSLFYLSIFKIYPLINEK